MLSHSWFLGMVCRCVNLLRSQYRVYPQEEPGKEGWSAIRENLSWYSMPAYNILREELGGGERGLIPHGDCFWPFGQVVNKDHYVAIASLRLRHLYYVHPHPVKRPVHWYGGHQRVLLATLCHDWHRVCRPGTTGRHLFSSHATSSGGILSATLCHNWHRVCRPGTTGRHLFSSHATSSGGIPDRISLPPEDVPRRGPHAPRGTTCRSASGGIIRNVLSGLTW